MFVTFLKRLVGQDEEALETERTFKARLAAVDKRTEELGVASKELEEAGAHFDSLMKLVATKQAEIALSTTHSGQSSTFSLNPDEIPEHLSDVVQSGKTGKPHD